MGSRYLTDLADVCRAAGLHVIEVDGWQTRARGSGGYDGNRPWCIMWHHTASDTSPENDVNYIVHGCPDAPVANLYLARDGTVHVCAAGATNTNGKGGPFAVSRGVVPVDSMNTHAIGIEAANDGLGQVWPAVQIAAYFALTNALTNLYGLAPDDLATHAEWAPGRKIDPATAAAVEGPWQPSSINSSGTWNPDDVRDEAGRTDPPPLPPEDDMNDEQARQLAELHAALVQAQPGFEIPGGGGVGNLNAAWAALWGEAMIADNVLPLLVAIQAKLDTL